MSYYNLPTPAIISGKRTRARNRELQRQWDSGNRAGLVVRPADDSAHLRGEAWDVDRSSPGLAGMAALAQYAGVRWGGYFRNPDQNHFDLGNE